VELTIPGGFRLAGVHCGIKRNATKRDLTVIVGDSALSAAGVFTTSRVCAAPVKCNRRRLPSDRIRGLVTNSGVSNACTGPQGDRDAERMCALLAQHLGCGPDQVLVCSTGVIGRLLPMDKVSAGIAAAYAELSNSSTALDNAAVGILTTDTRPKVSGRTIFLDGRTVRITGLAKGAAMIGPNMATMLAFIMTDATATPSLLESVLRAAVDQSFHCVSVEGHTSTNDSVILMASGSSGAAAGGAGDSTFANAVCEVCQDLARAIADDAEGASHLVTIDVVGCRSDADARQVARTVANSPLVKTAIYGADPNWGRIISAAGYAGIEFSETDLSLRINGTLLYDRGTPTEFDPTFESARIRESRDTHVELVFTLGSGKCRFWTCDLTQEYVRFNADYTT
jgi:glutamate N-acetyltransferase/amino-acid N-acetyltransferase